MPILRVTRQGSIGQCDCKVGGCRICGSSCRRCKCSCDGVSPLDALSRKAGGQRSTRTKRKRTNNGDRNKCHILVPKSTKMAECVADSRHKKRTIAKENTITNVNERDDSINNAQNSINTNRRRTRSTTKANSSTSKETINTSDNKNDTKDKCDTSNDIRTRTLEVSNSINDDNDLVATAKEGMSRIDSQSTLCNSFRTTHTSTNEPRICFGRKQISHMKQVMKDTIIDNDDRVFHDTNNDENSTKSNHSTKVKETSTNTNINEEKENNSTSSSTKQNDNNMTDVAVELQNAARCIERNSIHTDLIENLVIPTNNENDNTSCNNDDSITKSVQVAVPKLPSISEFAEFEAHDDTDINLNDEISFISGISDNFVKRNIDSIDTDSIFDFFCQPEYIKKNIPSKKLRESSKDLVNFKNQRFRYLYQSVRKMVLQLVNTFVPGPSKTVFVDELFTDILSTSQKKVKHKNKPVDFRTKWEKLSSVICKIEKETHYNSFEKRMMRAILNKGVSEGDLNDLMKRHDFKFAKGRARMRAREDANTLLSGLRLPIDQRHVVRVDDDVVHKVVDFILSSKNVVPNSYGIKQVKLSRDEIIVLPKLQRKNQRIKIYEDYKVMSSSFNQYSICRQTFYQIINKITAYEQVSLSAIDYVTASLVNETCEVLDNIVEKVVIPTDQQKASDMIHSAKYFLKHQYNSHWMVRA